MLVKSDHEFVSVGLPPNVTVRMLAQRRAVLNPTLGLRLGAFLLKIRD